MNENVRILINISLKFVPKGLINNIPALVQIMVWRWPGDKPLSESMVVILLTHICVTRPQWVKLFFIIILNIITLIELLLHLPRSSELHKMPSMVFHDSTRRPPRYYSVISSDSHRNPFHGIRLNMNMSIFYRPFWTHARKWHSSFNIDHATCHAILRASCLFITLRPRQNGHHFPDAIFKCIFLNENVWILIKIPVKFVAKGPINNIPALFQIMAWHRSGDEPLSETMMVTLLMHICVTRPRWVITTCLSFHHDIQIGWHNSISLLIRLLDFQSGQCQNHAKFQFNT